MGHHIRMWGLGKRFSDVISSAGKHDGTHSFVYGYFSFPCAFLTLTRPTVTVWLNYAARHIEKLSDAKSAFSSRLRILIRLMNPSGWKLSLHSCQREHKLNMRWRFIELSSVLLTAKFDGQ